MTHGIILPHHRLLLFCFFIIVGSTTGLTVALRDYVVIQAGFQALFLRPWIWASILTREGIL
jgi:hypothetical protein